MRIIFMGTPDFAVPSLEILLENGYDVVGVITATDKMGGRGNKQLIESEVKQFAKSKGLNILQPEKLKSPDFVETLQALKADLQIIVAFRMLPEVIWNMPRIGTFNLHGSLLPKYRGAAPINWAVINGEKETGLTTFFLQHQIDTGNVLFQTKVEIGENETTGELYNRMKVIGADLVLKTVKTIESGDYAPQLQNDEEATHAPKIFHDTCQIDFNKSTQEVHNFIRGMSPVPTAWTILAEQKLKIFKTLKIIEAHEHAPGSFHSDNKKYLKVATVDGYVDILELQLQGKKRMSAKDFLNGYKF
jgi:methionyl-tRNA formyltransferase